ncbi:MAG: DUF58 domain-containing protein [Colwellia sp.]
MWFNRKKQQTTKQEVAIESCQSMLASINSNGVSLAMPELLHYQNKTALIDLSARKNIHGQMSGNYLSRSKGRGMEFDEVRHYQTGDDIRAIDWRVTARTGKTHTKLFREEVERPVLIATDLSDSMHFGSQLLFKSVQASHLAALVAWHTKSRGDRLGGIVFNNSDHLELKPRSRKEGVLHYLHALKSLHALKCLQTLKNTTDIAAENEQNYFSQNCARIRQLAKPGSLVYLITDAQQLALNDTEQQQNSLRHLSQINQHCELVICLIEDPLEQKLPVSAVKLNVTLTDGTHRQQLTLGDKNTATRYQRQALVITEKRQQLLSKTGARVIHFSAGQTLEAQLKTGADLCNP